MNLVDFDICLKAMCLADSGCIQKVTKIGIRFIIAYYYITN